MERLCKDHRAYRWLCGAMAVTYHTLSNFRVDHRPAFDAFLAQTLAVLKDQSVGHGGARMSAHFRPHPG